MDEYSLETSPDKNFVFGFAVKKIAKIKSRFQTIEILKSPVFGNILKLDGAFQTSEFDEFLYHEPLVHPALFSHPNPQRVLIIGGGDGGALREVLKHKKVKKAVLAELDQEVIRVSKKYFKRLSQNIFNDSRVELYIGDGKKYLESSKDKFDVIILDLTDPIGPAASLSNRQFYETTARHFTKNGLVSLQAENLIYRKKFFKTITANLKKVFKIVRPFASYIPIYGSEWLFAIASKSNDPLKTTEEKAQERLAKSNVARLKWYSAKRHRQIFLLPPHIEEIIAKK